MSSMTTTYLLPAILLNPAFILHCINTFVSHYAPPPHTVSHSPHPFMESIGPVPGSKPYMDVHADDQMCWRYTAIMVIVQMLAFGRVQDNRSAKKIAKAAKLEEKERLRQEKERLRQERKEAARMQALAEAKELERIRLDKVFANGSANGSTNGLTRPKSFSITSEASRTETEDDDGSSTTGSSEEEMIV